MTNTMQAQQPTLEVIRYIIIRLCLQILYVFMIYSYPKYILYMLAYYGLTMIFVKGQVAYDQQVTALQSMFDMRYICR